MKKFLPIANNADNVHKTNGIIKLLQYKFWPELEQLIQKNAIGSMSVECMEKISRNIFVTEQVFSDNNKCKRFFNYEKACLSLNDNNFIVIVEDIGVYCIFDDSESYRAMLLNIYGNIYARQERGNIHYTEHMFYKEIDDYMSKEEKKDKFRMNQKLRRGLELEDERYGESVFTPCQIVFSDGKQKIIIISKDGSEDIDDKVLRKCKDYFKSDVNVSYTDGCRMLVVNTIVNDLAEAVSKFRSFREHLEDNGIEVGKEILLSTPDDIRSDHGRYVIYNISVTYDEWKENKDNITNKLMHIPAQHVVVNVNNNYNKYNNCNITNIKNNVNNVNNIRKKTKVINNISYNNLDSNAKQNIAREWIKDNLPFDDETTVNYYNRYFAVNEGQHTSTSKINEILTNKPFNYINKRENGHRIWVAPFTKC